jgi:L-lysine exporter family protein LysE/ArgO
MLFSLSVYFEGLGIGAGLIIAIGAQNAFVLKQGIRKNHEFITALTCACIDLILISLGVLGLGKVLEGKPVLLIAAGICGALFLSWFGLKSVLKVFRNESQAEAESGADTGLRATILALLGFSLLNPHVYLDTVILLGSIGARHASSERPSFILGAASASFLWFFGLAYGARILTPLFKKSITWKVLDAAIALVMWFITAQLVIFVVGQFRGIL